MTLVTFLAPSVHVFVKTGLIILAFELFDHAFRTDEFVKSYNNTNHSSIKMTPTEASKRENENKVWRNLYSDYSPPERKTPKFSVDDKVRIKGYTPRWTEEVFTVSEVHYTEPITYKLKDLNGEETTNRSCKRQPRKCLELKKLSEEKETSL